MIIAILVFIIVTLVSLSIGNDAGKKYVEKRFIHVINMLERSPSSIIFEEGVKAETVWYKCLEIVTDEYNRLSDLKSW